MHSHTKNQVNISNHSELLRDIGLIFGIWVYNDELQIKFTFCSGSMIVGPWTLKFGQIFSCHHFITTRSKIIGPELNVNLICNSSLYTHIPKIKSISPSIAVLGNTIALGLWNLAKYLVVTILLHCDLRYWLDFWLKSE
jgi:hypothetical protein